MSIGLAELRKVASTASTLEEPPEGDWGTILGGIHIKWISETASIINEKLSISEALSMSEAASKYSLNEEASIKPF